VCARARVCACVRVRPCLLAGAIHTVSSWSLCQASTVPEGIWTPLCSATPQCCSKSSSAHTALMSRRRVRDACTEEGGVRLQQAEGISAFKLTSKKADVSIASEAHAVAPKAGCVQFAGVRKVAHKQRGSALLA